MEFGTRQDKDYDEKSDESELGNRINGTRFETVKGFIYLDHDEGCKTRNSVWDCPEKTGVVVKLKLIWKDRNIRLTQEV